MCEPLPCAATPGRFPWADAMTKTALVILTFVPAPVVVHAQPAATPDARAPIENIDGEPWRSRSTSADACEATVSNGAVTVSCTFGERRETRTCREIARQDLTPAPGNEIVYGCPAGEGCEGFRNLWEVVVVVASTGSVAAIATTYDMSCGHRVTFERQGRRTIMRLVGGGEDGTYRARYAWIRERFVQVGSR